MPADKDYEIAANALKQVGLWAVRERSMLSLSGGERQLILVARSDTAAAPVAAG
jgi:ABC-type cobalamin/Fe3+-siderophores transport system ATPase subunit